VGFPHESREELTEKVKKYNRLGYQLAIHANGDAAIDDVIFAYREAQKDFPRQDTRFRIEHAQASREDQLDAMKELGISPSFFVSHTYYWGEQHRDIFMGPKRAANISPLRSAIDKGIRFSIHLDTPVTPMRPLQAVWSAVNRLTRSGDVLGPDQRITPLQALRAVTIDAAWQEHDEKIKGSIEPGKFADLIVLSDDPLTVNPVKIKDLEILETIVGGKSVYRKEPGSTASAAR
jgi:predicted amidohydrolase YtcJ